MSATETNRSLRIFDNHKDAVIFAKTASERTTKYVDPKTKTVTPKKKKKKDKQKTTRKPHNNVEPETSDTDKVSTDQLKQLLRKRMMNKSGNKVFFYYKELTGKSMVVVVLDVFRETNRGDDEINRSVSHDKNKHIIY